MNIKMDKHKYIKRWDSKGVIHLKIWVTLINEKKKKCVAWDCLVLAKQDTTLVIIFHW